MDFWRQWVRQPQTLWIRRAIFQIHLWSGIGFGLYVLLASVTGSVLVYANELYNAATPSPVLVEAHGLRLSDTQIAQSAALAYPGYVVANVGRPRRSNQAVDVTLRRGDEHKNRLFDPYTGRDLGNSVPPAILAVSKLIELHDDLLAGPAGRRVNGVGAVLMLVVALTGVIVWWPGIRKWRRGLIVRRGVGWRRFVFELHSAAGFWSLGFILIFGVSGAYLGNPQPFQTVADWIEPATDTNAGSRVVDQVIYWLAFLHFGRINGIGIPCNGPGLCDQATKFVWAAFGLAPAVMFVTGAIMWWHRVLKPALERKRTSQGAAAARELQ